MSERLSIPTAVGQVDVTQPRTKGGGVVRGAVVLSRLLLVGVAPPEVLAQLANASCG